MKEIEKLLSAIQYTKGGKYSEDEAANAKFILHSLKNGLIKSAKGLGDDYFSFEITGDSVAYVVCFGKDPDKKKYPTAERALRASEFMIHLEGFFDKDYNCYIVPDVAINPPSEIRVKDRVFGADESITITKPSKSSGISAVAYRSVYELEVVVNVTIDYDGEEGLTYDYVRINDKVVVEARFDNEEVSVDYAYEEIEHLPKESEQQEGVCITEEKRLEVEKILSFVSTRREELRILELFSRAEKSKLRQQFLDKLKDKKNVRVGQISVEPRGVFVASIPDKTFTYSVTTKGCSKTFALKLTWNNLDDRFKNTTPLYVVADENGSFEGLTYESEYSVAPNGEEKVERAEYDEACKLVVAYGYEKGNYTEGANLVPLKLTLAPTDPFSVTYGERYKGVSDWAVKLTAVSAKLNGVVNTDRYYLSSSVVRINAQMIDSVAIGTEGVYLKSDCSICEYLGKDTLMWNGDLSDEEVSYIDSNGEVQKGRIPKDLLGMWKKTCPCCTAVYYADETRWKKYQEENKLLDGNYSCAVCKDDCTTVWSVGGVSYMGYKACIEDGKGNKTYGKVLAKVRWAASTWVLDDNRLYQCKDCKKWVYDPNFKRQSCNICGANYCNSCFSKDKKRVMLDGKVACLDCCTNPTSVKNIEQSSVRSLTWCSVALCTDVYRQDEVTKGSLFVRVTANLRPVPYSNGGNVFQCSHCGKWIYYDGKKAKKCATCNETIGDRCYSDIRKPDASGYKQYKILNADLYYCEGCPTRVPLVGRKTLYKGIRLPNTQKIGAVLDNGMEQLVDSIVHCAGCNQKIFYNRVSSSDYVSCELCGRILEKTCESKLEYDEFFQKKLCPCCKADKTISVNGRSYQDSLPSAIRRKNAAEQELKKIDAEQDGLAAELQAFVWANIEKFAPYFNFFDRIRVMRAKRKGKNMDSVIIFGILRIAAKETVPAGAVDLFGKKNRMEKSQECIYAKFRLTIKNKWYKFVYDNGKITLEEIY